MALRADADDAANGDYGVLLRLLTQLQQMRPDLARELLSPELPVLGHVMPELLDGAQPTLETFAHPSLLRDAVQSAVERVLLSAAEQVPMVVAIDDIQARKRNKRIRSRPLFSDHEGDRLGDPVVI